MPVMMRNQFNFLRPNHNMTMTSGASQMNSTGRTKKAMPKKKIPTMSSIIVSSQATPRPFTKDCHGCRYRIAKPTIAMSKNSTLGKSPRLEKYQTAGSAKNKIWAISARLASKSFAE